MTEWYRSQAGKRRATPRRATHLPLPRSAIRTKDHSTPRRGAMGCIPLPRSALGWLLLAVVAAAGAGAETGSGSTPKRNGGPIALRDGLAPSATILLSVSPERVEEGAGAIQATVTGTLDGTPRTTATTVSVSVGATGDRARAGVDYANVETVTLTIPANIASGSVAFALTPVDDSEAERTEAVSIGGKASVPDLTVAESRVLIGDDDYGSEVLWSATMTAGGAGELVGYSRVGEVGIFGTLGDVDFACCRGAGVTQTISLIATSERLDRLMFMADSTTDDRSVVDYEGANDLVLHVDDKTFPFSMGVTEGGARWSSPEVSWTDGDTVALRITAPKYPELLSVTISSTPAAAPQTYGRDETIEFMATFDERVFVTGAPRLAFLLGGEEDATLVSADYVEGSGSTKLVFRYTVAEDDFDEDGLTLARDGDFGTPGVDPPVLLGESDAIRSAQGADAILGIADQGPQPDHNVDGTLLPPKPRLMIDDISVTEGTETEAVFVVKASFAVNRDVLVEFETADVTANSGADYTAETGTATIPAGETGGMIRVPILDDSEAEPSEMFSLVLRNPSDNAVLPPEHGAMAVIKDDDPPIVSIDYHGEARGEAFEHEPVVFTLTRMGSVEDALTVTVSVDDGGDVVDDAVEGPRTVSFDSGSAWATFAPGIVNDREDEPHSSVSATLVAGVGYAVGTADVAVVRIRDDDGELIELRVDPLERTVSEGETVLFDLVATAVDDGTFDAVTDLERVFGTAGTSVSWLTIAIGEATADVDYMVLSEEVRLGYGDFHLEDGRVVLRTALPGIPVFVDDATEPDERFLVELGRSPSLDGRFHFAARENIDGLSPLSSRQVHFRSVVTVPGGDGELRLVNGDVAHEGRLEILYRGEWGTICDDYWTDEESDVACRQLGYPAAEARTERFLRNHGAGTGPYFGQGTGPIWLDNVLCEGDEARLIDCPRLDEGAEIGGHNCRHEEDVGIRCLAGDVADDPLPADVNGVAASSGPGRGDPASIASLDVSGRNLRDVDFVAAYTGLKRLNLTGNAVEEVSALGHLSDLVRLDLSDNALVDIGPLSGLRNLRYLNLSGNGIEDLSALAALVRLEVLVLDDNEVADLGPLTHLVRLRHLALAGNRVEDLAPLADMAVLERLDLYDNPLGDLSPLGDLDGLVWLRLPAEVNPDAIPVERLAKLRTLATR